MKNKKIEMKQLIDFCPISPKVNDKKLKYPLNRDCDIKILSSSKPDVIDLNGDITAPVHFEIVTLKLQITDKKSKTKTIVDLIRVLVPAKPISRANLCTEVDYSSLRYGLLVHWVSGDNISKTGAMLLNSKDQTIGGIDNYCNAAQVEKIADDLQAMGFEFVSITDFHGLGITSHPCAASDFWRGDNIYTAQRDLLGEMITALRKRGIYAAIFTHPLDGHDYPADQREQLGWDDPTDNYKRWNDFINDVYGDISSRYGPDLICMGFDSEWGQSHNAEWENKLDLVRLRKTIHSYAPYLPLASLSPANDTTDYSIREAWRPSWLDPWMSRGNKSSDYIGPYDVWDWPCYSRPVSPVITKHWTTITLKKDIILYLSAEDLFRYFLFQLSSAIEGPAILWGNSPYIDGGWEKGVEVAFLKVKDYIEPIRDSIYGTLPSTSYYMQEGTILKNIPNGTLCVRSKDDKKEFLHVLLPPQSNVLKLSAPSDNKSFTAARILGYINNLAGNKSNTTPLKVSQDNSSLVITLPDNFKWDLVCTTIELTVQESSIPKRSLAFHKGVTCSSSVVSDNLKNCPYCQIRLVDGIKSYMRKKVKWGTDIGGWKSKKSDKAPYVTIDLFKFENIKQVVLYPSMPSANSFSGVPSDFSIDVSMDGVIFTNVFSQSDQKASSAPICCNFNNVPAQYVRITAQKLRGAYFSLAEIEIF